MKTRFCFCVLLWAILSLAGNRTFAASSTEGQLLSTATDAFKGTFYDRAEQQCAEFIQKFPASPHLPEIILLQARSRLEQSNYVGALQLLATNQTIVGAKKDEFIFWMGETRLREGNYPEAAALFGRVISEFASSPRRLESAVKQAVAGAKQNQWQNVTELLANANGAFQLEAKTNAGSDFVLQGLLLLGEAQLNRTNYAAAEAILEPLGKRSLSPTNAWAWHFLLSRVQLASGKTEAALNDTTNLLNLAAQTGLPALQAQSASFQAQIFEQIGRLEEAIAAYTSNLGVRIAPGWQREAIAKIAQLSVTKGKTEEAAQVLEKFLAQNAQSPAADLAWAQLGELRLRQYVEWLGAKGPTKQDTNVIAATNRLALAIKAFETVAKQFNKSDLLGSALMDLGWCFWFEDRLPQSADAFRGALSRLPSGPDRARAHFKLGDAQFREKDYAGAMTNYQAVLKEAPGVSSETNLFEPALYHIVRAGLELGDLSAASNALSRIVTQYPKGYYAERATLLFGQRIGMDGNPAQARAVFEDFIVRAPDSPLKPELELAIARTLEEENNWPKAVEVYDLWLKAFTNNAARPEALFYLAQAMFHAENETNAYSYFTNFVTVYPKHVLTAQARRWVADFYFNSGAYAKAESDYQIIAHDWPGTDLYYQAMMMAGRAAYLRQGWSDAADYFYNKLAGDTNCPADLHFRALYAYGDTLMSQVSTNKIEDYRRAIGAFETICQQYASNELAASACGEKAICLLQLAQSPEGLTNAADAFAAVLTNSVYADGTAISIAKIGLGITLERQAATAAAPDQRALRLQALGLYLDVLDGLFLKESGGDEFWTKEAGKQALRLASDMQEWQKVEHICDRMAQKLPQLAPTFEEQKRKAIENLARIGVVSEKFDRKTTGD